VEANSSQLLLLLGTSRPSTAIPNLVIESFLAQIISELSAVIRLESSASTFVPGS
jgi:hypothetical protein